MVTTSAIDVIMPQMGVSVSEGTITKWLKTEGEEISADEPLLEISTDKVDTEIPSPGTGIVQQILVQEGETVAVGTKLAVLAPEGAPAAAPPPEEEVPEPATAQAAAEASAAAGAEGEMPTAEEVAEAVPEPATAAELSTDGKSFVSPVVARIASEHGVDVGQITGTGRGGRVTKKDILSFIESGGAAAAPAPAKEEAPPPPVEAPAPVAEPAAPPPPVPTEAAAGEEVELMTAMRKGIAEHMRRSVDTAAHVTTVFEVDMSRVVELRNKLKKEFEASYGVKLTYLPFIARAAIGALRDWPWVNGELRGEKIVTKKYVNLGVAVALEGGKGLIVPVLKNAEERNLLGIARGIADLADRARSKKLTPDDVHGGTFTITNPGGFGAIMGTPIINQPQSAILDVEALVKRPVVVADERGGDVIAIRPMMNLCLSYDHRLVDGAYAAQFMRDLKRNLESWDEAAY